LEGEVQKVLEECKRRVVCQLVEGEDLVVLGGIQVDVEGCVVLVRIETVEDLEVVLVKEDFKREVEEVEEGEEEEDLEEEILVKGVLEEEVVDLEGIFIHSVLGFKLLKQLSLR
jgi:hypothetical protein